jgi:CubicO group peptidase (beta-lactamase class C family)
MPKPRLQWMGAFSGLVLLTALAARAAPPATAEAQAAAVERSLLPTMVLEGLPPWTLAERMRHYHVPGVSIAIIQGGRIAWAKGYGVVDLESKTPVTPKTLFQAASLSKPVTAMAVLRLAEKGKLALDAPVNSMLRSWKLPDGPFTGGVTLERLLSHSAGMTVGGFTGYPPGAVLPTLLETLNGRPPANNKPIRVDADPGKAFRYSGGGYEVAQQVMVDVTGQTFPALMRETVLGPAGMTDSFFEQPLSAELVARAASGYSFDGAPLPGRWRVYPELAAAGLWTTASDLARFAIAVQQSRTGAPGALIPKPLAMRMLTPAAGGEEGNFIGNGLGFFIDQRGKGTFAHVSLEQPSGNDGFRALLVASTEGGYGVVVMTNGDGGAKLADEIVRGAAEVYGWKPLTVAATKRVAVSEEQLRKLAGRYRLGSDSILTVTAGRNTLKATPLLGESFELYPVEGGDFIRVDPPTRFTFDGGGVVAKTLFGDQPGVRIGGADTTPLQLLLAGKTDAAVAGYRKLRELDSSDPAVTELRLNDLGYEVQPRSQAAALALFQLNASFYSDSPNAWDSLGEAFLAAGKRDEAARCFKKVRDLVPKDTHLPADLKAMLLANADRRLQQLEGH